MRQSYELPQDGPKAQMEDVMKKSEDRLDEIAAQFEEADEDADGQISLTEFRGLMLMLDRSMRDSAITSSFLDIDANRDGRIGLAEFRSWWLSH
jgi:Ca2+-binding EF-hand superfamily protein